MSWWAVLALCGAAYGLKALGVAVAGRRVAPERAGQGTLETLAVPVLAGLVVVQTLDAGQRIVLDARLPALLVAALLVWRRAPLLVVVVAAGAVAASLRLAGM